MCVDTMDRVLVPVIVENAGDLQGVHEGRLSPDQVRRVDVAEALVDTGATSLCMPSYLIAQLGLVPLKTRPAKTSAGTIQVRVYGPAHLTIMDRDCSVDITELPDECPVLVGQIPLESLDFVVDSKRHRLIGNPNHGGEQMIEIY